MFVVRRILSAVVWNEGLPAVSKLPLAQPGQKVMGGGTHQKSGALTFSQGVCAENPPSSSAITFRGRKT